MNCLLKKLGYRDRKYRTANFSLTIEPGFQEIVSVNERVCQPLKTLTPRSARDTREDLTQRKSEFIS